MAEAVSELIMFLTSNWFSNASNIMLVGHSLGAHIAGSVGKIIKNSGVGFIKVIVGLDPAGPFITDNSKLNVTDAEYVQVIHTNAGIWGYDGPLGHADFYINMGGPMQEECGYDVGSHYILHTLYYIFYISLSISIQYVMICSHSIVIDYYAESLRSQIIKGIECRGGYRELSGGCCTPGKTAIMGGDVWTSQTRGVYNVATYNISSTSYILNFPICH